MKSKTIFLVRFISCLAAVALVSCDGGGGSDSSGNDSIEKITVKLPDDSNQATGDTGDAADPAITSSLEEQFADQVFAGINQERVDRGLPALVRDTVMDAQCTEHNNYMIGGAVPFGPLEINHDNAQSRADDLFALGYTSFGQNTGALRGHPRENIVFGFVSGWINSPKHSAIILFSYTRSGIAITLDSRDGSLFASQIFGNK